MNEAKKAVKKTEETPTETPTKTRRAPRRMAKRYFFLVEDDHGNLVPAGLPEPEDRQEAVEIVKRLKREGKWPTRNDGSFASLTLHAEIETWSVRPKNQLVFA